MELLKVLAKQGKLVPLVEKVCLTLTETELIASIIW